MNKNTKTDYLISFFVLAAFILVYPWLYDRFYLQTNVFAMIPILYFSLRYGAKVGIISGVGISLFITSVRIYHHDTTLVLSNAVLLAMMAGFGSWLFGTLSDQRRALRLSEEMLTMRVAEQTIELQRLLTELEQAYDTTLQGWAKALELKDKETEGHSQRVIELSLGLGQALGLRSNDLIQIRFGALLHDIGKMGIADDILNKPAALTPTERSMIEQHPVYAYKLLKDITFLEKAIVIPYYHHERWDGKGYPVGLAGEEIPLYARIFSIVDVWDALLSDRPYRKAWSKEVTIEYIRSHSGRRFDPQIVAVFLERIITQEPRP